MIATDRIETIDAAVMGVTIDGDMWRVRLATTNGPIEDFFYLTKKRPPRCGSIVNITLWYGDDD